jgi:hypothetical protein
MIREYKKNKNRLTNIDYKNLFCLIAQINRKEMERNRDLLEKVAKEAIKKIILNSLTSIFGCFLEKQKNN